MEAKIPGPNGSNIGWLNTESLAEQIGCHPDTVKRWRNQGMPYYNAGIALYILSEVMEWMKNRKRKKRSPGKKAISKKKPAKSNKRKPKK